MPLRGSHGSSSAMVIVLPYLDHMARALTLLRLHASNLDTAHVPTRFTRYKYDLQIDRKPFGRLRQYAFESVLAERHRRLDWFAQPFDLGVGENEFDMQAWERKASSDGTTTWVLRIEQQSLQVSLDIKEKPLTASVQQLLNQHCEDDGDTAHLLSLCACGALSEYRVRCKWLQQGSLRATSTAYKKMELTESEDPNGGWEHVHTLQLTRQLRGMDEAADLPDIRIHMRWSLRHMKFLCELRVNQVPFTALQAVARYRRSMCTYQQYGSGGNSHRMSDASAAFSGAHKRLSRGALWRQLGMSSIPEGFDRCQY
ncbi:MAG: hypothetical protein MHM6MM_006057 [Cercozoa sp. M6MM]